VITELKKVWKEKCKVLYKTAERGLTTKQISSENMHRPGQDSNPVPAEFKSDPSQLAPHRSLSVFLISSSDLQLIKNTSCWYPE
jgi:hypothetical protein